MSKKEKIVILVIVVVAILSTVYMLFNIKKNKNIIVGESNAEARQQNMEIENTTNKEDSIKNAILEETSHNNIEVQSFEKQEVANENTNVIVKNNSSNNKKSNIIKNITENNSNSQSGTTKTNTTTAKKENTIKKDNNTTKENTTQKNNIVKENTEKKENKTESESNKSTFDINYWINFAKSYGISIGLKYDTTAVECWDNPIIAGENAKNLQSDIQARLNRYKKLEEVTDFYVWAEKRNDGNYNLYIGYA